MTKGDRFVNQVTSGRWLITIAVAVCIVAMCMTNCYVAVHAARVGGEPVMPFSNEALFGLIGAAVAFYFAKPGSDAQPEEKP